MSGTATFAARPGPLPHNVGGVVVSGPRISAALQHAFRPRVLPDSVDLRSHMPAVGDQGQIGSCVAWTIAHGMMGYYANTTSASGAPYAPLYLYMRVVAPGGAPNAGLYPASAFTEAQNNGVDTQDDYSQGMYTWQTPPTQAEITNAASYKITGWNTLWVGANQGLAGKTAIETALASGAPVGITFQVYQDFMNMGANVLYNTLTGTSLGGHMVTAVGYDAQGIWIRNSWGTWWGTSGDAHLSWAFLQTDVQSAYTISGLRTPGGNTVAAPTVSGLTVHTGPAGTSVTISGSNLGSATAVNFGSASAQFTSSSTSGVTKLVATAPAHDPGAVSVTVTNPGGTSAGGTASAFTYTPPAPAVTAVSPGSTTIFGGSTVTVTGTSFTGSPTVKVGTTAGTQVRVLSPTSLQFVAPAMTAGQYDVTVKTAYGTSTTGSGDQITYVNPPAPAITSMSPTSGPTYTTSTVTLTGTDLKGANRVTLGGTSVPFTRLSDTQLRATLPTHAAGAVDVQVVTPGGTSPTGTQFTYVAPPVPAITGLSPATGFTNAARTVTITGTGFTAATRVTAAGSPLSFTKVSDTQLRVTLPTHTAGAVDIQVTTPGGTSPTGTQFTYSLPPAPVVTGLSVTGSPSGVATTVVIQGTSLGGTTRVTVAGVAVAFTQLSDGQIRVTLPKHAPGTVTVQVTTPGGTSGQTTAAVFTYGPSTNRR
ncbi:MAG TPA: IPT/TIG domain-containing protein [Rugosimonospora sp.]|nr:IPT/TIG domain-containing protein [Rugosimonospora sp.]